MIPFLPRRLLYGVEATCPDQIGSGRTGVVASI
jgi:hypothetical protein